MRPDPEEDVDNYVPAYEDPQPGEPVGADLPGFYTEAFDDPPAS